MSEKKELGLLSKDVNNLEESIEDMKGKGHSISTPESKVKEASSSGTTRFLFGVIFTVLFFSFIGSIVEFFSPLNEIILSSLLSFDDSVKFYMIYTISALILTILIYVDVFKFVLDCFLSGIEPAKKKLNKMFSWQYKIILVLALLVLAEMFFIGSSVNSDDIIYNFGESTEGTTQTSSNFFKDIMCKFDPQCFMQQQNQQSDTQAETTSYEMRIEQSLSSYRESQLQTRELPINLEVESKGGRIFLDKVECYEGAPFEKNLLDSRNLGHKEIKNQNLAVVGGINCDVSGLSVDETKEVEITPVIYYTLVLDYNQQIPIVDFRKYREEQGEDISENRIREEVEVLSPVNTASSALSISRYINPNLPIIINGDTQLPTTYYMDLTFEKSSSSLGEIQKTTLINLSYSQNHFTFNELNLPYNVESYDGITSLPLEFSISTTSLDSQGSSQITLPIRMTFENSMKKEDRRIKFTLINDVE